MKKYMSKMSQFSIVNLIMFVLVGLFLVIKPATTLSMISYILGLIILIHGIVNLVRYYVNKDKNNLFDFGLVLGIIEVVVAIIFISTPEFVASIIPLILGVWILVNGIFKLQFALNLKSVENDSWIHSLVVSIVSIVFGVVLISNPFSGAVIITRIIGIFLIIYAVLDFLQSRTIKKTLQEGVEFIK